MSIVTKQAPNFIAPAIMPDNTINENFDLYKYLDGSLGILFFWPLDFTFVCPSEIISFNNNLGEFTERQTKIIGISVDSHHTHLAWKLTPFNKGGVGEVRFPMVSDLTKSISRDYKVLLEEKVALRATFLIDNDLIIRHQVVNDLPIGRNIQETLRTLDSWILHKESGGKNVCPANWRPGQAGIEASTKGISDFLTSHRESL